MNVLLVTEVFPPQKGGSGRWLWELYRRLPPLVHIVAGSAVGDEAFDAPTRCRSNACPLGFSNWGLLHPKSPFEYLKAWRAVSRAVRRVRPDAIHAGKSLPDGLVAMLCARTRGMPFWCYVHGEELRLAHTSGELRWLNRLVLAGATRVIANSAHTRDILRDDWHIHASKIVIMHPGVDTQRFVPAPADAAVRERLGWTGRKVVLTVGALQKRKGQDMLIRALPEIRRHCPNVLYVIAGEGWERPYLEALVTEHQVGDLVQFLGIPGDEVLVECYQQCDLFALPNREIGWDVEGFGIVLLEAQAAGKAVIAGRSGGTRETIEPGVTGELIPCDTPDLVAATVSALLNDDSRRAAMGRAGREWVTARFDWDPLTRQAVTLFGMSA